MYTLGLIKCIDSMKDTIKTDVTSNNVFKGLGCLPGKVKIQLKQVARQVIHPPCKEPIAFNDK